MLQATSPRGDGEEQAVMPCPFSPGPCPQPCTHSPSVLTALVFIVFRRETRSPGGCPQTLAG